MGKHDKMQMMVANVPTDEFYKARIGKLEKEVENLKGKLDANNGINRNYIERLERKNEDLRRENKALKEKFKDILLEVAMR